MLETLADGLLFVIMLPDELVITVTLFCLLLSWDIFDCITWFVMLETVALLLFPDSVTLFCVLLSWEVFDFITWFADSVFAGSATPKNSLRIDQYAEMCLIYLKRHASSQFSCMPVTYLSHSV